MTIPLPNRRSTARDTPQGREIVIPARDVRLLLLVTIWLAVWGVLEVSEVRRFISGAPPEASLFATVWLLIWTIGGVLPIYIWLWVAFGEEILALRAGVLTVRSDLLGVGKTREYDVSHVKNLRVSPQPSDPFGWGAKMRLRGSGAGTIAFDYGAKTFRFGAGLEEAEASQIIDALKARHTFGTGV